MTPEKAQTLKKIVENCIKSPVLLAKNEDTKNISQKISK